MAAEFRCIFNHDVIIDLVGYRLRGHNELDQPSFTQPLMYKQIDKMTPVARLYEKKLLKENVVTMDEIVGMKKVINDKLESEYQKSKNTKFKLKEWESPAWEAVVDLDNDEAKISGVEISRLKDVGQKISSLPKDKKFHRLINKIFEQRGKTIEQGTGIDWGTAEALAFATLIQDGYNVRLSGQDVERGTFSHRHAHVFYQDEVGYYNPINECTSDTQGEEHRFIAANSHLSEFAVLGFEYGYAQAHPNTLVLWEA